jgi:hypothetical protein
VVQTLAVARVASPRMHTRRAREEAEVVRSINFPVRIAL